MEGEEAKILRAQDVARRSAITCRPTDRIGDIRDATQGANQNICVVVNGENVVLGLLRNEPFEAHSRALVEQAMELGPVTIRPNVRLVDIIERLQGTDAVLVTTPNGRLVGILYREDAERALQGDAADVTPMARA